jgi:hypothetical protein
MAGPSGIGAVQDYIRAARSAGGSRRSEYMTALRRELAKHGRDPDLVEFDCFFLCMSCGHLSEPRRGDPMRSEAREIPRECAMCGAQGLVDLRQTSMVESLLTLESSEAQPRRGSWILKIFGVLGLMGALFGVLSLIELMPFAEQLGAYDRLGGLRWQVMVIMLVGALIAWIAFVRHVPGSSAPRRTLPRRWRMPQTSKQSGAQPHARVRNQPELATDLLHAPLSGRPCIAYEVAVRDDDDAKGPLSSWRLLEQDNVGFRVGELEVAPGEALLQRRRELVRTGSIAVMDEPTRRYMRMRGLLGNETVYIYETILAPGDVCEVSRGKANGPVLVRGR